MSEISALPSGSHCRICGSTNLNLSRYVLDRPNNLGLYQALIGDRTPDQLIRPCNCRGNFAFAHRVCLSEWIETTKHEFCDVCRFKYNVIFHERSIYDWMTEARQVNRILKMLCLSTLVYYISSLGILNHFLSRRTPTNVLSVMVFASSCVWGVFCTISLGAFALQLLFEFKRWRRANQQVLVEENKNPQFDSQPSPKDILKSSGFKPT